MSPDVSSVVMLDAKCLHFRNYQIQCLSAHSGFVQYNGPQYIGSLQSQFLNLSKLQLMFLTSYNTHSNQPNIHFNLFYQKLNLQTHKLYKKNNLKIQPYIFVDNFFVVLE